MHCTQCVLNHLQCHFGLKLPAILCINGITLNDSMNLTEKYLYRNFSCDLCFKNFIKLCTDKKLQFKKISVLSEKTMYSVNFLFG